MRHHNVCQTKISSNSKYILFTYAHINFTVVHLYSDIRSFYVNLRSRDYVPIKKYKLRQVRLAECIRKWTSQRYCVAFAKILRNVLCKNYCRAISVQYCRAIFARNKCEAIMRENLTLRSITSFTLTNFAIGIWFVFILLANVNFTFLLSVSLFFFLFCFSTWLKSPVYVKYNNDNPLRLSPTKLFSNSISVVYLKEILGTRIPFFFFFFKRRIVRVTEYSISFTILLKTSLFSFREFHTRFATRVLETSNELLKSSRSRSCIKWNAWGLVETSDSTWALKKESRRRFQVWTCNPNTRCDFASSVSDKIFTLTKRTTT